MADPMTDDPSQNVVLQRQDERHRVMRAIFDLTEGERGVFARFDAIAEATGLSIRSVDQAVDRLLQFGLAERLTPTSAGLTPSGLDKVEAMLTPPPAPSALLVPRSVYNFHGNVGSVQSGSNSIANVHQSIPAQSHKYLPRRIAELRAFVAQLPESKLRNDADDILVEWIDAEQNDIKILTSKRVEREGNQLREYLKLNDMIDAISTLSDVLEILIPMLVKP